MEHPSSQPTQATESIRPSHGRSRRTLYGDLIVSIILAVAAVFALVVSLSYGYLSYTARVQSAHALTEFSDYLHDSLELPIWNIDEEGIKKICNSFFENTLVAKMKVTDHEGSVFFEKQRRDITPGLKSRTAITHDQLVVGYFEIALDAHFFMKQQRQLMWLSIIVLAAVTLVLAITLRFVLRIFLLSPLEQLLERTDQISRGEYAHMKLQAPQEEIRAIASRFNTMADRIQRRERSLKTVNLQLEKEIGEHQDAEAALRNSQEELHSIIRSTPDVIYRLDTLGRFTFVSDAIRRYGFAPEALIGRYYLDCIHEEDRPVAENRFNQRQTGERSTKRLPVRAFGEYCDATRSDPAPLQANPVFMVDAEGLYVAGEAGVTVFVGTQGIARDITEQRQMESARLESEDRLHLALDASSAGIWQLDLTSGALIVDDRISTLLGYGGGDFQQGLQLVKEKTSPETWTALELKFKRHVAGKAPMFDHEFSLQSSQGQWKWFHTKAKVVRFDKENRPQTMVGIMLDTSDKKRSEAERERLEIQLQQAQKMEAIGTLAGGIAHDFNNILGAILGYAQLTQMQTSGDRKVQGYVENIFNASERAKGLVEQILTFTRQGKSQKTALDMALVLKEVVKLLRATIPVTIEISQQIPSNLGAVLADPTQIHQVLMNLCTNAAHAMEAKGGRLTVTLESVTVEAGVPMADLDLEPGPYIKLAVEDTGTGMDRAVIDRIFEPYYTTKAVGEGTGMGLATVHGIVRDHGGHIQVKSVPGKGSVFNVFFPGLQQVEAEANGPSTTYARGSERILFVDDEELLVDVGVTTLTDLGYDVTGTTRPAEALEWFTQNSDAFDLVITDMTMPAMTGDQLAAQIMKHRPGTPVIICTGFSKRLSAVEASSLDIRAVLMKPVSVEELSRTIREVLDQTAETEATPS